MQCFPAALLQVPPFGFERLIRLYGYTVHFTVSLQFTFTEQPRGTISMDLTKEEYDILDCTYPSSFISMSCGEFFAHLELLSRNELSSCVWRFRESVPKGCKTKTACIKLIESDFSQQTKQLIESSTPELFGHVSTSPLAGQSVPTRFSLVCWAIHDWYGITIASQLLSSQARWNPPEVANGIASQPAWFQTPVTQLSARLRRVDAEAIRYSCNLYLAPDTIPKSKTGRYDFLIQRFRARALYLLSLSNIDFAREYIPLLPQCLSFPSLPRCQLVEVLLGVEFGPSPGFQA